MKYLTSIWTTLGLVFLLIGMRVTDPQIIEQIRLISFDNYQNTLEVKKSDQIIIINIGEAALGKNGQWPWPRSYMAQTISDLRSQNAGLIGITTMFPEEDRFKQDKILSQYLQGTVLAQLGDVNGRSEKGPYVGTAILGEGEPTDYMYTFKGLVSNISVLEDTTWGVGLVNGAPEVDNITRRIPLIGNINNQPYPSFSLEMVRVLQDEKSYSMRVGLDGIEDIMIPPYAPVKTDSTGSVWINYSNEFDTYEYGEEIPNLQAKIVLLGVSAAGIQPQVATPAGLLYPHQIQAQVLQTLMNGDSISRPQWADAAEIGISLAVVLLMVLSIYYLPIWAAGIVFAAGIMSSAGIVYYTWSESLILLDLTFPLILYILSFTSAAFNNFYKQFKLRQQIKGQFSTYLSPDLVNQLVKDPSLMKLGGDRKEMTFLFMDICGFTPISEHYKNEDNPEGLVELVNEFLDAMTDIILKNGGTIDKYMGDCIMAFWNAPLPCKNHAEMAVKSAIEIEEKTNELKALYMERGLPDINVGTGVNTGDCIVGNMGSKSRFDYSVIGDAVNLAARLEATAARGEYIDYKTIISRATMLQVGTGFVFKDIGTITVKGKSERITIYSPTKL